MLPQGTGKDYIDHDWNSKDWTVSKKRLIMKKSSTVPEQVFRKDKVHAIS